METRKKVIVIGGPTASGKTAMAIRVAQQLGTEIISADSRQFFREMNIGVARPEQEELEAAPHHFIAHLSVHDHYNAGRFERDALSLITQLHHKSDFVVVVGGSGLYLNTLMHGMNELPEIDEAVRSMLEEQYKAEGLEALQVQLKEADPDTYAGMDVQNPQRVMRALEICMSTGQTKSEWLKRPKQERDIAFQWVSVVPDWPREQLYARINRRVELMMEKGLLEEVRSLVPYKHLNALKTVGYKELFDYLEGKCSLEEAVAAIQQNTRRFAKRQLTWFRSKPEFEFVSPEQESAIYQRLGL